MENEIIVCKECQKEFVLSTGFLQLMRDKPEIKTPKRCRDCRAKRKLEKQNAKKDI